MLSWYNLGALIRGYQDGGHIKGYAAGGTVVDYTGPETAAAIQGGAHPLSTPVPELNPNVSASAWGIPNVGASQEYFGGAENIYTPSTVVDSLPSDTNPFLGIDAPELAAETVGTHLVPAELAAGSEWTAGDILQSNQVLQEAAGIAPNLQTPQYNQDVPFESLVAAGTDPAAPGEVDQYGQNFVSLLGDVAAGQPLANNQVATAYLTGNNIPGVNTGIPQGGHARSAIDDYLAGRRPAGVAQNSYTTGQTGGNTANTWAGTNLGHTTNLATESDAIYNAGLEGGGDDDPSADTFEAGEITLGDGETTIAYDTPSELAAAENIAANIEAGGINPETGDYNISAGPNVLSASDEGIFGFGSDYHDEFAENYDANLAHAEDNPYGMTTGNPLYDQGYVGISGGLTDAIGGAINNSIIGTVGEAITGNPLLPDVSSLLPGEDLLNEALEQPGINATSATYNNDDGAPTHSAGGNEWGSPAHHAEILAAHEAATEAETNAINSDVSDDDFWDAWENDDSASDDNGGSGGGGGGGIFGGYGCYVATALNDGGQWADIRKARLLAWCMDYYPEDEFRTKLWRNGYMVWGKSVIAPHAGKFKWVCDGFYEHTVGKKRTVKSLIGKAFFTVPSYVIGVAMWATGNLKEVKRT